MKNIKILLTLILMSQLSNLQARPDQVISGRGNVRQTNSQKTVVKKIGGLNKIENNSTQKAAVASTAINNNNNQIEPSTTLESTENQNENQPKPTQTIQEKKSESKQQVEETDNIPAQPAAIEPDPIISTANQNDTLDSTSFNTPEEQAQIEITQISTEPKAELFIEDTDKNETQDQETILKTLKALDEQNKQNKILLTESSMDQLFNNFIYFKNFIVENFTKEKIVRLLVEFIDQIYPKETVIATNILKETSQTSNDKTKEISTTDNKQEEENTEQSIAEKKEETEETNQLNFETNEYNTNEEEDQEEENTQTEVNTQQEEVSTEETYQNDEN